MCVCLPIFGLRLPLKGLTDALVVAPEPLAVSSAMACACLGGLLVVLMVMAMKMGNGATARKKMLHYPCVLAYLKSFILYLFKRQSCL